MTTKKNIFNRIMIGVKKGIKTPTLPDNILKIHMHPITRIYRVISGISVLLLVSNRISQLPYPMFFYLITLIISTLFLIYNLYISYHRIKHIYFLMKSGQLDVRNSPLDRLASVCSKLVMCAKGACDTAAPAGLALGIMLGVDQVREANGLTPFFTPLIGKILIPETPEAKLTREKRQVISSLTGISDKYAKLVEFKADISKMSQCPIFTKEDIELMENEILVNESQLTKEKDDNMKRLSDLIQPK